MDVLACPPHDPLLWGVPAPAALRALQSPLQVGSLVMSPACTPLPPQRAPGFPPVTETTAGLWGPQGFITPSRTHWAAPGRDSSPHSRTRTSPAARPAALRWGHCSSFRKPG